MHAPSLHQQGLWKGDRPEGPGRYVWVTGNEYDGEWKAGRMHGHGTFAWAAGERYVGEWKVSWQDGVQGSAYDCGACRLVGWVHACQV